MKKIFCLLTLAAILLLPALPVRAAANDSVTIAAPYAIGGFYYLDYEHSLNETAALNISGMYLDRNGMVHAIFQALFGGVDFGLAAVDVSWKRYPNGAQNGLYYGINAMAAQADGKWGDALSGQSYFYAAGASLGVRKITDSGFTYDLGVIAYYDFTDQVMTSMVRLNVGYGW